MCNYINMPTSTDALSLSLFECRVSAIEGEIQASLERSAANAAASKGLRPGAATELSEDHRARIMVRQKKRKRKKERMR